MHMAPCCSMGRKYAVPRNPFAKPLRSHGNHHESGDHDAPRHHASTDPIHRAVYTTASPCTACVSKPFLGAVTPPVFNRTPQYLRLGIFASGSSVGLVRRFAAAS